MMIDSHAHLEMEEFDDDRDAVLGRAAAAGLTAIITVGTTIPDCEKAVELARLHPSVYAAVGIHPHEVKGIDAGTYDVLRVLAQQEKVVAIGEIGLDFFYDLSPREVQLRRFAEQLDLALELDLPVIIHDREAHAETLRILQQRKGGLRGVLHCFSGDEADGPGVHRAGILSLRGRSRDLSESGSAPGGGAGDSRGEASHRDRCPLPCTAALAGKAQRAGLCRGDGPLPGGDPGHGGRRAGTVDGGERPPALRPGNGKNRLDSGDGLE